MHADNFGQYLCQICNHCIWNCVFETECFKTFWRLWELVFWQKNFQNLTLMFLFIQKTAELVLEKLSKFSKPDSSLGNVVRYTLWFECSEFDLKYIVRVMLSDQPPKFKVSVWNFLISETSSKCNLVFRLADSNWVVLKRKVEYRWACTFWAILCFNGVPWTWDGARYYKLSIATGVMNISIFLDSTPCCMSTFLERGQGSINNFGIWFRAWIILNNIIFHL